VLAVLDTNKVEADVKSTQAKLDSAKANVVKATADLQSAQSSYERTRNLVQNNVTTQQSLEDARYKYDSAVAAKEINEAAVLSAEADLQLAEVNLCQVQDHLADRRRHPHPFGRSGRNRCRLAVGARSLRHRRRPAPDGTAGRCR
jgi:multidrug resistance efflux pump